jgi:hypothetical protein
MLTTAVTWAAAKATAIKAMLKNSIFEFTEFILISFKLSLLWFVVVLFCCHGCTLPKTGEGVLALR